MAGSDWAAYVGRFHHDRPGITEDTLGRARDHDPDGRPIDPYQWLAEPLPAVGTVVDLACGSSPLRSRRVTAEWVGVDRSTAELFRAPDRVTERLVCADAAALPLVTGSCAAVVCSMALMVLQPLGVVLAEIRRVLRPGGTVVFLLPGTYPFSARDVARYARLLFALRRRTLAYPNDRALVHLEAQLRAAELTVTDDQRRRFVLPLGDRDARLFVRSLYLPGVSDARLRAAEARAGRWAEIGIPLRRVTARVG
jgi:SAM-dependent methyltransferase